METNIQIAEQLQRPTYEAQPSVTWARTRENTILCRIRVWFMVFNVTFNNISAILRRSVLLVEETGVPRENTIFGKIITIIK